MLLFFFKGRESKLYCLTSFSMNALEWNGNHETSSLHREEVVLQACQIKEWHHIIFVNADSSSSIIRQTWKVLFLYHMVRHHFPFISGVSTACLSRSPASSAVGNLQKQRECDRESNRLYSQVDLFKTYIQRPLLFVYAKNQRKLKNPVLFLSLFMSLIKENWRICSFFLTVSAQKRLLMCHHFPTQSDQQQVHQFLCMCETFREFYLLKLLIKYRDITVDANWKR